MHPGPIEGGEENLPLAGEGGVELGPEDGSWTWLIRSDESHGWGESGCIHTDCVYMQEHYRIKIG